MRTTLFHHYFKAREIAEKNNKKGYTCKVSRVSYEHWIVEKWKNGKMDIL